MRLKHIKGSSEKIEKSEFVIKNPTEYKGVWHKLFNNNNPIYIEIGMGKGKFIYENALNYPDINFIGIEKYDSVMVRAVEKIEEKPLSNLKLIRMDATNIQDVFDHEIETIYLNFSDPWPKKRHAHRRLTSPIFLEKYEFITKPNYHIIQKTDNMGLFEYSIISFNNNGYKINELSLDLHNNNPMGNIETEYEEKFKNQGKCIYKIDVTK